MDDLPAPKLAILDRALNKLAWPESIEHWANAQPTLIGPDGAVLPILPFHLSATESLRRDLQAVGLSRVVAAPEDEARG